MGKARKKGGGGALGEQRQCFGFLIFIDLSLFLLGDFLSNNQVLVNLPSEHGGRASSWVLRWFLYFNKPYHSSSHLYTYTKLHRYCQLHASNKKGS